VYISSPYIAETAEEMEKNKSDTLIACEHAYSLSRLAGVKIAPITPHVNFPYVDLQSPEGKAEASRMGLFLLSKCDEMWVAGDTISDEMRDEIQAAVRMRIPVISMGIESRKIQDVVADLKPMFDEKTCFKGSADKDYTNKILVLNPTVLAPWAKDPVNQLWYAKNGFGLAPNARGRAVYATCLYDGEEARWDRMDFMGIADPDRLPAWAGEHRKCLFK